MARTGAGFAVGGRVGLTAATLAGSLALLCPWALLGQEGQLRLLEPDRAAEIEVAPSLFSWSDLGPGAHYELTIVELELAQTPAGAVAENSPILAVRTADSSYSATELELQPGQGYAWRVTATGEDGATHTATSYFNLRFPGQTVSREDAISLVLHRLVVPPTLDHPVVVFLGRALLQPGDEVWPWDQPERTHAVTSRSWFAWINDDPQAFFAHPTRFVLIDAQSGALEVHSEEWWPILNGESLWMSDSAWRDRELIIYSELHPVTELQP